MTPLQAARAIALDRWADWGEQERLVVNLANIYSELARELEPLDPLVGVPADGRARSRALRMGSARGCYRPA